MKKDILHAVTKKLAFMAAAFLIIAALPLVGTSAKDASKGAQIILTTPASNDSGSVNIGWYDMNKNDKLYFTEASDSEFKKASVFESEGELSDAESFYEFDSAHSKEFPEFAGKDVFRHLFCLKNLPADTEFIYKIVSSEVESEVHSFKTAADDTNFTFAWFADMHADPREDEKAVYFNTLLDNVEKESGKADLVVFSGDLVKYGNLYTGWADWDRTDAAKNHILVSTPGNKEYYKCTNFTNDKKTKYYSGEWYANTVANPNNGPETVEGTYYTIYNNVMFVSLNTCQENNSKNKVPYEDYDAIVAKQQAWFKDVVTKEEGNYDYIVVLAHYEYFIHEYDEDDPSASSEYAIDWGGYYSWYEIFDEYGVDFLLSADYHEYCRTKQIYGDAVSTDPLKGTVYITFTEIIDYIEDGWTFSDKSENPLIASYVQYSNNAGGAFEVTPDQMTFKFIGLDGEIIDSVSVANKRKSAEEEESDEGKTLEELAKANTWVLYEGSYYYFDKNVKAVTGTNMINGAIYRFDKEGKSSGLGIKMFKKYVYGYRAGELIRNETVDIFGKVYDFDDKGYAVRK